MEPTSEMPFGPEKLPAQTFESARARIVIDSDLTTVQQEILTPAPEKGSFRVLATKHCLSPQYINRVEVSLDKSSPLKQETRLGTSVYFGTYTKDRQDKGYYDEKRRNELKRILEARQYKVEPLVEETSVEGIVVHSLIITKDDRQYELQLGYDNPVDAGKVVQAKIVHGRIIRPRVAQRFEQESLFNTSIRTRTLALLANELDSAHFGTTLRHYAEDTSDMLAAVYVEAGEELDEDIRMTLR